MLLDLNLSLAYLELCMITATGSAILIILCLKTQIKVTKTPPKVEMQRHGGFLEECYHGHFSQTNSLFSDKQLFWEE